MKLKTRNRLLGLNRVCVPIILNAEKEIASISALMAGFFAPLRITTPACEVSISSFRFDSGLQLPHQPAIEFDGSREVRLRHALLIGMRHGD